MNQNTRSQSVSMALIAMLWGFVLNGFFLFLPFEASKNSATTTELFAAAGWVGLCLISIYVGRSFSQLIKSRFKRVVLVVKVLGLALIGVLSYPIYFVGWSWLLVTLAASISLSLLISRVVFSTVPKSANATSAFMGAAPLIGSLLVSLGFAFEQVRDNYLALVSLVAVFALWPGLRGEPIAQPRPPLESQTELHKPRVLIYAFLLGLGVALINTYVFERVAEVLSEAAEAANTGSLLVALASLAGVIASLMVAAKALARYSVLTLARMGSVLVTSGAIALVVAPDIALVGLAGVLVGAGFGLANGLELNLVSSAAQDAASRTALFGDLVAVTTIPFVFATLLGFGLSNLGQGTIPIFMVAAVLTALSIVALAIKRA